MNNKTTFYQKFISSSISNAYALIIIASSFIYLIVFTLPFLLPQLYYTIPPVDYTKLTNYSPIGFFAYLFGLGTLFALFIGAVRLASHLPTANSPWPTIRLVWMGSLIFAVILLFSYPLTAIDLFIYAIRSRGWALYGLPPLSTPPELLPTSDPWLGLAGEWIDATSPYGPLWELIALGAFYLSGGSFLVQIFLLKLVGLLAYLGCIGLIYRTLLLLQPNWAIVGSMAFAWNPLVLFES
ncbi:MAG: hypothetical protein KDJ65_33210, partial [Anaerolineae bacterium]|nr:hypothetical protein [Anaerolineae bacterium]